ncbi:capsule biosynthesis protein [Allorhizobium sp. BGMRC 0089]|uniref:capsule biosynthesis protein n=1 Tax=Allorhizobium sonneratiae TaxID=2934936 RepID=UPI002033E99A|nr:capsule biosynthesis protein [Allorhizobium sonneratiae]MCM2292025.1 capsule biosynthesis protein [Allorhizobium sonneratiae]
MRDKYIDDSRLKETRGKLPGLGLLRSIFPVHRGDLARARSSDVTYERIATSDTGGSPQPKGSPPYRLISFVLLVLVPFFVSALYFAFIASDQYTVEARFAVRSMDHNDTKMSDSNTLSMSAATQDAQIVASFIESNEMLDRLQPKIDYRAIFDRPGVDFLSRISRNETREDFLDDWKQQVKAYIDASSGIITLKVRTFSPQDSLKLANAVIAESEILINQLSLRAREDALKGYQDEVKQSGAKYQASLEALNRFQTESGLYSPEIQAQQIGKLMTGLIAKKLDVETREYVARQSNATKGPAFEQLELTRKSLDKQIEDLKAQMTGGKNESLSRVLLTFSRLETDRMVAEKLYEASQQLYSQALADSLRKSLYVVVFVHPALPEESLYPLRIFSPFMVFLTLAITWCTAMLIWASVEDHRL